MQIAAQKVTCGSRRRCTISRRSEDKASVVPVELTHNGATGYGEAAPIERYDESAASALAWLEQVTLGDDPFAFDEIFEDNLPPGGREAARAAVNGALYDLQGKLTGRPVPVAWRAPRRAADVVDDLAWRPGRHGTRTEKIAGRGFRRLKLKLGGLDGSTSSGSRRCARRPTCR